MDKVIPDLAFRSALEVLQAWYKAKAIYYNSKGLSSQAIECLEASKTTFNNKEILKRLLYMMISNKQELIEAINIIYMKGD